jgi:serine/threonine-protein kinase
MGAVYVGEHLRMGRRDAIKVLRPGLARDAEATARFVRGARNVSTIRHPNVCTIYDFSDTDDGLQFLAMEYIEGETLKDTLEREGRLELRRAADIASQVADALQAAHDVGIVHRDLKPGNIMIEKRLDGSERVKVVDFDIAKGPADAEGSEVTRLGFVIGTPEYMSPEQLTGDRLDGRSDVYSLGIMLFRMLTGALPFSAATTQDLMLQRLTTDALRIHGITWRELPPALDELLRRALARQAAGRPATASEFARELRAITHLSSKPLERIVEVPATRTVPASRGQPTAPSTATDRTQPFWLQRRVLIPAAVLVVGIVIVAFVVTGNPEGNGKLSADSLSQVAGNPIPKNDPDTATGFTTFGRTTPMRADSGERQVPRGSSADKIPKTDAVNWSAVLLRQLDLLSANPSTAVLRAVFDSATSAWDAARTHTDSITAALVAAQAKHELREFPECLRWARIGTALGDAASFKFLLDSCRP